MEGIVYPAQMQTQSYGHLQVNATSILGSRPITGATVRVSITGQPNSMVEEAVTNVIGQTNSIDLLAPNLEYSMEPSVEQPYSEYDIEVVAPGFETVEISGAEILPGETAIQEVNMIPLDDAVGESAELFVIPPHTLFGDYPPKIAEAEIKSTDETGEIVLSRVVVPEFVVVHDGPPSDSSAQNYYVKYKDYIKNVASSEIYATWSAFNKPTIKKHGKLEVVKRIDLANTAFVSVC